MGLLPEGNMVWVSVDDALYLWEYGGGSLNSNKSGNTGGGGSGNEGREKKDFVEFKVPSGQCVVSVGIVRPKPGKWVEEFSKVYMN